jgi:hypothetical protein
VCVLALGAALVNLVFFTYPRVTQLLSDIPGIARIEISGKVARITVAPNFAEQQSRAIPMITQALRQRGVDNAMLVRQNGSSAGQIAVREGRTYGLAPAGSRADPGLPSVALPSPAQPPPSATPQPAPSPAAPTQSTSALLK